MNFTKEEVNTILKEMVESGELELGWDQNIKEFELVSFNYLPSGKDLFCIVSYKDENIKKYKNITRVKLTGNPCNEIELNNKTVLIDAKILKQRIRNKSLEKLGI